MLCRGCVLLLSFLGSFFPFWDRKQNIHRKQLVFPFLFVLLCGGGGVGLIFFFLCFLCLLCFHSVAFSPVFFEKSSCIICHVVWWNIWNRNCPDSSGSYSYCVLPPRGVWAAPSDYVWGIRKGASGVSYVTPCKVPEQFHPEAKGNQDSASLICWNLAFSKALGGNLVMCLYVFV